jgi:hypothetical protein
MNWSGLALAFLIGGLAILPLAATADDRPYRSPYSVRFTHRLAELVEDIEGGERGEHRLESSVPFRDWYSHRVREEYQEWGPPARHFPAPRGLAEKSIVWRRERVIAVALRFQGYGYQHHHIPDWDPPRDWPWKKVGLGHNGKGVDCSNFAAFAYNLALGIKPSGAVRKQAEELTIPGPGEDRHTRAEHVRLPGSYEEIVRTLRTGDLLYIRNHEGEIAHVVLWVGPIGQSPDDLPLVLDSHGEGVKDCNGNQIPFGIHLRPFREKSWYHQSASHALRILREE